MRKYSERVEDGNISIVPSAFLDTGKAQRAAANFMKWLFSLLFLDRDVQMSEK